MLSIHSEVSPVSKTAIALHEAPAPEGSAASLVPFFRPRSVAVVGVSRNPAGIGSRLLEAILQGGFAGPVFPVNPKAHELQGLRAYPSVRDLPEPVDLAVVAVPSDAVLGVVDDCAARGVRALALITAGFAEIGPEGRQLQDRLMKKVRGHGMRLLGPNCVGLVVMDPAARLNAVFVPASPPAGRVAMSSDSGALGFALLRDAARLGLGLSAFVSVGNRADVGCNDLLEYWETDPHTDVILLYLESFGDPRRFVRVARRVSQSKPIVAVKAGRTQAGQRAASSHTAALAGSDRAADALFHQTGVIRAETLEEMLDLTAALSSQPLPRGRHVAILTNAGGPGILAADTCEAAGLVVPQLSPATRTRLAAFLPASASLGNPVDMIATAGPEEFSRATEMLLTSGEADALLAIYVSAGLAEVDAVKRALGEAIATGRRQGAADLPVLACVMGKDEARSLAVPGGERVPCYAFPESAARVLGKMADYFAWRSQPPGQVPRLDRLNVEVARSVCTGALHERGPGWLSVTETRTVLEAFGLPLAPGGVATTADEAAALARRLGFPVAVKLASDRIVHKSDIGAVRLGLSDEASVRRAFQEIRETLRCANQLDAMQGVQVQRMISGGTEVMAGVTQDSLFGPLIAFGLGGIYVEILGDVCFRVPPLTDRDAAEMVRSVRASRLLEGYRGHPKADVPALESILLRVSRLVEEVPEICELDLNPIMALPLGGGCRVVDARIRVQAR